MAPVSSPVNADAIAKPSNDITYVDEKLGDDAMSPEEDYKEKWPEYVKAKLVAEEFRSRLEVLGELPSTAKERAIRAEVAKKFAIKRSWWFPSGFRLLENPMKSDGMSFVPWWISW